MNNLFRGLLAGYGAHKLGGGCISTVLIFILLWWLLGTCGAMLPAPEATAPIGKASPALYASASTSPIASGIEAW
ncbi:MAG: hypothetical protein R3181_10580 [Rubricoccaceae bacterium]|nr:hypothetical protein [Rubricoccaceae bacterium]